MWRELFSREQSNKIQQQLDASISTYREFGAVKYSHLSGTTFAHISAEGLRIMEHDPAFIELLGCASTVWPWPFQKSYRGISSIVTKEHIQTAEGKLAVALKRIDHTMMQIAGYEQFDVLELLGFRGYLCSTPLAATNNRLISKWVEGKQPNQQDPRFNQFLNLMAEEIQAGQIEGKLSLALQIDRRAQNYRIAAENPANPYQRYVIIDPVYVPIQDIFG